MGGDRVAVRRELEPLVLAMERRLEASSAMASVLPQGLQRGSVVGVSGAGSVSLALALAAGPVSTGSWLAIVGGEDVCLAAVEQLGIALHRVVLVAEPPRASWGSVVAALTDAFDVIIVATPRIGGRDARRLMPRVRERGTVIVDLCGGWPEATDLSLRVVDQRWLGLEEGHGALTARQVWVEVTGRRGAARPITTPLWLPGPRGIPEVLEEEVATVTTFPARSSRAS